MSFPKKEYEVQGHTFTLKATTPRVRKQLEFMLNEAKEELMRAGELAQLEYEREQALLLNRLDSSVEVPPEVEKSDRDEYQTSFDMFCVLTDGPHELLDFEDFDEKVAEDALENFLPNAARIALELGGLLK